MPDLRSELEALRDKYARYAVITVAEVVTKLTSLLTAHAEAVEWRGPWKCETCGEVYPKFEKEHDWPLCPGTLVPYERRKGAKP